MPYNIDIRLREETKMTHAEFKALVERLMDENDTNTICVRTQEAPFELGSIDHESCVWDNGEETDETVGGLSATMAADETGIQMHTNLDLGKASRYGSYFGGHTALIAGKIVGYGEDAGEVILEDAQVLHIVC
jgi:hypothetical protein